MELLTYVKQQAVFVPIGEHMLCIGSVEDVEGATSEEIVEMIYVARQTSLYQMIACGRTRVLH